jgi:tetratricopeptide (TPR) repeat protein
MSSLTQLSHLFWNIRNIATLELLSRVSAIFDSLDSSSHWTESKTKWPEAREGPVVTCGDELIARATFSWSLYEHALLRSLQDLLTATLLLPGFAQAWRRAGDALGELRQYRSAIEYYEVAVRLDGSLQDTLLPSIERFRVMEKLVDNAESRGWPAEAILSLIEE